MCPHCHAGNPAGSLFCVACAMPLAQLPAPRPAAVQPAMPVAQPALAGAAAGSPQAAYPAAYPLAPPAPLLARQVRLVELVNLQPSGRTLDLPDTAWAGQLLLGRPDLAAGVVVDLDLNALGGFDKRVSRKHAKLHYVTRLGGGPNEVRVEDWDSAHGTWVNKIRLAKGASEPLNHGDELRFAELVFRVELT